MALDVAEVSIHGLHCSAGPCDTCCGDASTGEVVGIYGRHHSSNIGKTEVQPFEMGSSNAFVIWRQSLQ